MSKINIRESLNRLDIKTDNKYDLRNTYDCSNISDDKKKKLAEALNKNASAKTISRILDENSSIKIFPRGSEEYEKLDRVATFLTAMSPNKYYYYVGKTYFDYGQDWKWTTILAQKNDNGLYGDSYQALNPRQQEEIILANSDEGLEEIARNILRDARLDKGFNENLTEDNYGGAYDIEDDMFFTREDIVEFAEEVCEYLGDIFGYQYNINNVYMDGPKKLYLNIYDNNYIEVESTFDIDMRKIRQPSDLFRAYGLTVENWFQKAFAREYRDAGLDESLTEEVEEEQLYKIVCKSGASEWPFESALSYEDAQEIVDYYNGRWIDERGFEWSMEIEEDDESTERVYPFDESLKEDIEDEIDFDEEEYDNSDGVEEGNTFFEDGREWTWIERIAGPIHLDFDNWAVWSARDTGYIRERIEPLLSDNRRKEAVELLTKLYDEAEIAYFVVDEDTGFIDWGPVETSTEAQDFLNGKVEDYENDEEYEEIEIEEESLQESKAIKNDDDFEVILHYDDIGNGKAYDYKLGYDEVVDYLRELAWSNGDGPEDANKDEYLEWVMDNFDELANKYESNVLNYFEDEASQYEYDHRD